MLCAQTEELSVHEYNDARKSFKGGMISYFQVEGGDGNSTQARQEGVDDLMWREVPLAQEQEHAAKSPGWVGGGGILHEEQPGGKQ